MQNFVAHTMSTKLQIQSFIRGVWTRIALHKQKHAALFIQVVFFLFPRLIVVTIIKLWFNKSSVGLQRRFCSEGNILPNYQCSWYAKPTKRARHERVFYFVHFQRRFRKFLYDSLNSHRKDSQLFHAFRRSNRHKVQETCTRLCCHVLNTSGLGLCGRESMNW